MKRLLLASLLFATTFAHAGSYQSAVAKQELCKDQGMLAGMLAKTKRAGGPMPDISALQARFPRGHAELIGHTARIADENYQLDTETVAKRAWAFCMDNIDGFAAQDRM